DVRAVDGVDVAARLGAAREHDLRGTPAKKEPVQGEVDVVEDVRQTGRRVFQGTAHLNGNRSYVVAPDRQRLRDERGAGVVRHGLTAQRPQQNRVAGSRRIV